MTYTIFDHIDSMWSKFFSLKLHKNPHNYYSLHLKLKMQNKNDGTVASYDLQAFLLHPEVSLLVG